VPPGPKIRGGPCLRSSMVSPPMGERESDGQAGRAVALYTNYIAAIGQTVYIFVPTNMNVKNLRV